MGRGGGIAVLRLFAAARQAAGIGRDVIDGVTLREVLDGAIDRYGPEFGALLPTCRVWVNGESVDLSTAIGESDEVAVLPPVSGGN
jgi:molybdopterin synthase sulfur carrier subunit